MHAKSKPLLQVARLCKQPKKSQPPFAKIGGGVTACRGGGGGGWGGGLYKRKNDLHNIFLSR